MTHVGTTALLGGIEVQVNDLVEIARENLCVCPKLVKIEEALLHKARQSQRSKVAHGCLLGTGILNNFGTVARKDPIEDPCMIDGFVETVCGVLSPIRMDSYNTNKLFRVTLRRPGRPPKAVRLKPESRKMVEPRGGNENSPEGLAIKLAVSTMSIR
jgi:hypothetical protein